MNTVELKAYIIQNDKIPIILESIGCTSIRRSRKYYSCSTPLNSKASSTTIKRNNLKVKVWADDTKHITGGDIITLASVLKGISLGDSIKLLHKILGFEYNGFEEVTEEQLELLSSLKGKKEEVQKLKFYSEEEMLKYYRKIPYIEWIREGIMYDTMVEFGIGYSRVYNRVVIPHRYYRGVNKKNNYVGLVGRTLNENYKILQIPKYFPLIAYLKTQNLYGLYENRKYIKKAGYINVFEAEKSVLKRHSRLDKTGVALGCHEISDIQVEIILSLNVDVVIQMDSDVSLDAVRAICERFYGKRRVYYVYDELGLMGEKESPADKHNKIYWVLWNRKKLYDSTEHEIYLNREARMKSERWY